MTVIKLQCYESKQGLFVKTVGYGYGNWISINGVAPEETFSQAWKFLPGVVQVESVQRLNRLAPKVVGYKLTDEALASDKIPDYLSSEEVDVKWDDYEDVLVWTNYANLKSLYTEVRSEAVEEVVDVEFEASVLGVLEVDNLKGLSNTTVKLHKKVGYGNETVDVKVYTLAEYNEIVKAVVPDIMLHQQPCKISSEVAYKIIRSHVLENINPKVAKVTSDYDFCFSVKKMVKIKPVKSQKEVFTSSGRSFKYRKFKEVVQTTRDVEVFEMTNAKDRYGKYTVIKGFEGNNLQELIDDINTFLEDLMEHINTPLTECEHCSGTGHIVETFDMNKGRN